MRNSVEIIIFIFFAVSFSFISCKSDSQHSDASNSQKEETLMSKQKAVLEKETAWDGDIESEMVKDTIEDATELIVDIKEEKKLTQEKIIPAKKKPAKKKPKAKKKLGKIVFEEKEYDFGKINEGDTITHKFMFTNQGNGPLEVLSADATCGCTRPSFPFIPVAPGEKGYIGVEYISITKEGYQKPEITVKSSGSPELTTLFLTGYVTPKPKEETAVKLDTIIPIKTSNKK